MTVAIVVYKGLKLVVYQMLTLIMPPTKDEQNKLVSILALIDRKIELNRAINQNLPSPDRSLRAVEVRLAA